MPTVIQLKSEAKKRGLTGYSKLKKDELIYLLSQSPIKPNFKSIKIAFCFLLYDTIEHTKIWEKFFSQDINNTSTIYTHLKLVTDKTPNWVKNFKVDTIKTDWCGENLIHAFVQMLKKAIQNKNNKYFALLSGSCIPLYTYPETQTKILSTTKSRMEYLLENENVFKNMNNIYNAHQWVIINRKTARDYIRLVDPNSKTGTSFIKKFRKIYKENGVEVGMKKAIKHNNSTWVGGCPDEIYPINWLHKLYGSNLSKHIKNEMTTYTLWDFNKDPDHPEVFNIDTVKEMKKTICHKHIFARKFTPEAANYIAMNCGKGKQFPIVRKELIGRLGNQMFQYASILGIAHLKNGTPCIIDDPTLIHEDEFRSPDEDLINVFKGPFINCGKSKYPFKLIPETGYGKYDIKPFLHPGNIEIESDLDQGFLQSWKYFESVKEHVKKLFTFQDDIQEKVNKYLSLLKKNNTKVIGIHARRGDHLALGYLRFPPPSYFNDAQNYFRKKYNKVKFIVATNDRVWAQKYFKEKDTEIISHSKSAVEDLAILSLSDGVITSLGTFGWWGGYLCNGDVIYYNKEFDMNHPINKGNVKKDDYYPRNWIEL